MNVFRNIAVLFLGIIFLISATGVLVYYSHCSCSGIEQVSVYVSPETCEDNFHIHHTHNEGGEEVCTTADECHDCSSHNDECGCNTPDVKYLKLDNQVVNEKIRIEKIQPVQLKVLETITVFLFNLEEDPEKSGLNYIDPPPPFQTSTDFLIHIHNLKIPVLA
ncbi:hypothetical protein [Mariniphaga sp.]|uniref:hypothetical protein n=1 Tax=Mariniphaga sp. TaxID=1954475 RepID=UPI0035699296